MARLPRRCFDALACRPSFALAVAVLVVACSKESSERPQASASARAQAMAPPAIASVPTGKLECRHLVAPEVGEGQVRTIRLRPPDPAMKTIVLDKTGVVVTFNREEFLTTARCMGLKKAVTYVQRDMGDAQQSPLRDAFQLSYVAAALLDTGRVGVRLRNEKKSRATIVRESWSEESCAGQCRAFGRIFRLSEGDPSFFFRVVDKREDVQK